MVLTNRKQRVKIGDIMSSGVYINGSVPKGTKLAALLFPVLPPIVINGETIHRVDTAKLLGVNISSDLT